ncbi:helix-turn-helix domain-containing protein [Streptomyces sp. NPDC046161]|uniref:GlxA family transcriptional regulator n=1 Tax=Streptomyces sp. NPDC046161 TaxID=3155132 RepID=UPI0033FA7CCE
MQRVAIVVQPGIRAFDLAVITEVWGPDRSRSGVPPFELRRCAPAPDPVALPGGLTLVPDRGLDWLAEADLVVVPALAEPDDPSPAPVLAALREAHARGTPVAALCAGAFVLAEAGLLEGRRAVTHWWLAPRLAARYPTVLVEEAPLYVEDSGVWTSAGVASGIDLCLHLVREAHGAEAAAAIARSMVTGPFRAGDHAQYLDRPTPAADRTAEALAAVRERALRRLHEPLDVATMARWAGMSPRSFARHFAAATGSTPHKWLLGHRLDAARRLLERTDHPVPEVARRAGFASEVTFRQHFTAYVGQTPRAYRAAAAAIPNHRDSVRNGS